ncbi:MAG: precorrin-8X methylmutase [Halanaerobiales bacterium]|nr:precorrin-8X methylmutase [Halanaerobiales bacterium]
MDYIKNPMGIEKRSMEIIEEELGAKIHDIPLKMRALVKRVIHTTADFEYADLLEYSDDFVEKMKEALLNNLQIITDTTMALSGINKRVLHGLGVEYHCYISDPEVVQLAKSEGITRSMAAVRFATERFVRPIFVFGNAPTAIFQLKELIDQGLCKPACLVGVPVGFVGAAESKELVRELGIPYIITRGRKGGSTVAAAIMNSILYELKGNITP